MLEYWSITELPTATANCYFLSPPIFHRSNIPPFQFSFASGMFPLPAHKPAALSPYAGPLPGMRTSSQLSESES
jgi:hypothetical protein